MSQSQQEAYHVLFKNTPQKLYQTFRMLSVLKQFANDKQRKNTEQMKSNNDWEKFSKLREELGMPTTLQMKEQFMSLPREKRSDLIKDCEKKVLFQAGEKDYEFFMSNNKMLAEPQILDQHINLDQLKNMLSEYGMQFHIKELSDHTKELHFFAKDANIAARAIERTLADIANDPGKVTKPTLNDLIRKAKEQAQEQLEIHQKQVTITTPETTEKAADSVKDNLDALSLFEDVKDGIEL